MSDEAVATTPAPWQVPAIDGSDGKGYLTAGGLQKLQKDAYDEAWEKGHAAGIAAGEHEITARAARYDELLCALSTPFDQLDEAVEAQLIELSIAVVKQLFRREINIDPSHIVGVAREAIQALPIASRSVKLHLHPDDAEFVRSSLPQSENEPAWSIVEDALTERGGCTVTTENSHVDATAAARLNAVVSRVFHDERST